MDWYCPGSPLSSGLAVTAGGGLANGRAGRSRGKSNRESSSSVSRTAAVRAACISLVSLIASRGASLVGKAKHRFRNAATSCCQALDDIIERA